MSAVFGRRRRFIRVCAWMIIFAATFGVPAQADTLIINVDQAQVVKLPERVATIVIGNPLIADASLQAGGILVVTGKGYGSAGLLALDRAGQVVMDKSVQVLSAASGDLVTVFKGVERKSYSCAPDCERRLTLGDSPAYFTGICRKALPAVAKRRRRLRRAKPASIRLRTRLAIAYPMPFCSQKWSKSLTMRAC